MQEQIKNEFKSLMASRNWMTWAIGGVVLLVAVVLKPLLILAAILMFLRALYLAYPILVKQFNEMSK